jgi:hypothetical protein
VNLVLEGANDECVAADLELARASIDRGEERLGDVDARGHEYVTNIVAAPADAIVRVARRAKGAPT